MGFLGKLRGRSLNVATVCLVVVPAFMCFGYNQAVTGGVLTLNNFIQTFPEINTVTTTGAQKNHNATLQGMY
jgi:hypothetical protein